MNCVLLLNRKNGAFTIFLVIVKYRTDRNITQAHKTKFHPDGEVEYVYLLLPLLDIAKRCINVYLKSLFENEHKIIKLMPSKSTSALLA